MHISMETTSLTWLSRIKWIFFMSCALILTIVINDIVSNLTLDAFPGLLCDSVTTTMKFIAFFLPKSSTGCLIILPHSFNVFPVSITLRDLSKFYHDGTLHMLYLRVSFARNTEITLIIVLFTKTYQMQTYYLQLRVFQSKWSLRLRSLSLATCSCARTSKTVTEMLT